MKEFWIPPTASTSKLFPSILLCTCFLAAKHLEVGENGWIIINSWQLYLYKARVTLPDCLTPQIQLHCPTPTIGDVNAADIPCRPWHWRRRFIFANANKIGSEVGSQCPTPHRPTWKIRRRQNQREQLGSQCAPSLSYRFLHCYHVGL